MVGGQWLIRDASCCRQDSLVACCPKMAGARDVSSVGTAGAARLACPGLQAWPRLPCGLALGPL